mgnify:CR=1 FL=1
MKKPLSIQEISDFLVHYLSNAITLSTLSEQIEKDELQVGVIIIGLQRTWDSLPCDSEGPTPEQDAAMDALLQEYAEKLYNL